MHQIVIRTLDDSTIYRLKQLAWQDGRPLEDMARHLLIEAVHLSTALGSPGQKAATRDADLEPALVISPIGQTNV